MYVCPTLNTVLNLQREIEKKTATYGIAAVLLAVLLTSVAYNFGVQPYTQPLQIKRFSSYGELSDFLKTNMELARQFEGQYPDFFFRGDEVQFQGAEAKAPAAHSTTNIQVAGVDEADIVKTDGEYLYVISGGNIYILRAYPPEEAKVLSKIPLGETYAAEIYLNGDKLAILGNRYSSVPVIRADMYTGEAPYAYTGEASVKVYDISDRASPILKRTIGLNGTLSSSRMINDYIYLVVNQQAIQPSGDEGDFEISLPKISTGYTSKEVQPTEIRYVNVPDISYYFTIVVAVNIIDDAQSPTYETFLTGATTCMYVSQSNMYLTVPNTNMWIRPLESGEEVREETLIYRVRLDREKVVFEAQGNVSGYALNQFSMDEYNGFFRIATTSWWNQASVNRLSVLDMSLNIVGTLSNIAKGERIYSARFMGDRCYLVTFRQVDPFFVIDLSNPAEPKVLGYLKIPGFSGYLHPYDENHIIGIGKQDNNLKLSLFDVTDVAAPTETAKFIVQGEWSDSAVLTDHKAFLFDKSKQLLALPVSINWVGVEGDQYYIKGFWQGAYVFDLSLSNGFVLRGKVTHLEYDADLWDSRYLVRRALYIENVFYTVSDMKVKMNSLEDFALIREIELSQDAAFPSLPNSPSYDSNWESLSLLP